MSDPVDRFRSRLLPALLTAGGATLLAAGLLTYTDPAKAVDPSPSPSPSPALVSPLPSASPSPVVSPSPTASPAPGAVATRVVIPALEIDLPVVKGPEGYPYCNVAMYLSQLHQPGDAGATYLYAHARTGMFLPLLEESKRSDGARMIGMLVQVYTADDKLHVYAITQVLRHQQTLDQAFATTSDELWLQTSEGPNHTYPKLQVVAEPVGVTDADPATARPVAKPVVCG